MQNSYTNKDYKLGSTLVRYTVMDNSGKVFLSLVPDGAPEPPKDNFNSYKTDSQFADCYDWFPGALCYVQLSHHCRSPYAGGCKLGQSYDDLKFKSQECTEEAGKTIISTLMEAPEGYEVIHKLTHYHGEEGFEVQCTFVNNTGKSVNLEMISSAALDGLSPYCRDDSSKNLVIHLFKSGWATEGKHMTYTLPELNLEKAWGGNFSNYKIGTRGSRATAEYFPYAAAEDKACGVMWGMQLYCSSTWQMEFSRMGTDISFTGGLGDVYFGNWFKTVKNGESFSAPKALIAAVKGDISELSDIFLKMRARDVDAYGEEGMPIIFNEWCTSWGHPSHDKNLELADKLQNTKVKYLVMDAGWFDATGDWNYKRDLFPNGMKAYADAVRDKGFVPGVWMEFECTSENSKHFLPEFDDMHLKHDGSVIVGQVNKSGRESFWDLRNPKANEFLEEKVISFLKDNGIGYLKVDYNADIQSVCDGAESGGEGLRLHMEAVREFFRKIKREIPDIVIENCSSGGMRLEPAMMSVTAMCSFSDAHECFEFPIIAANLHYLIPPRQSQIWCVLKPEFNADRYAYTISAGFLGRICWSGNIAGLSEEQMGEIYKAEEFYESVSDIIKHGKSVVYRTEPSINFRYPEGTQAVIRYSDDGERALLVYHCFNNPKELVISSNGNWEIEKCLYNGAVSVQDNIRISETKEVFGNVVLLRKRGALK
ncbi:MAG: glycoside hydrolase family 36 protein [Clostridia bacterium]|nr:glycoside hydrolase family 36 protein [Clostridia bacterium]